MLVQALKKICLAGLLLLGAACSLPAQTKINYQDQITNFPAACSTNQVATQIGTTPGCITITASYLPSTVVNSIVQDTNVTGTISGQVLTLGWQSLLSVPRGGTGVGTLTGIAKGNGTSAFTAAASSDVIGLWTGTCSTTTFLRGDGSCQTPSGSGNVSNTGTPTNGQLAIWTSATVIEGLTALPAANFPALTGDITTSAGALGTTLATVNSNVGSFTNANITVNAKGLVTAASNGSASGSAFPVTVSGTVNSGGIPCFNSTTNEETSPALAANSIVIGGGAGGCVSAVTAVPNGTTATTQTTGDNTTKIATDAFVIANSGASPMTTLGDETYGGLGGTFTRLAGPTTPNGVPQFLIDTPSAGAATAETFGLAGVPTNPQTGTTYTFAATDRASYVSFSNASAIAVTLPQAGSAGFTSNFVTVTCDIGAGTATITPTTSTISYTTGAAYTSGASTMTLTTGQCAWIYSDNTNYFALQRTGGAGSTGLSGMTAGQIPVAATATTVTSSVAESGTGNVCMTTSCVMTTPNLGTPSAGTLTNATGLPAAGVVSGALANGMTATTQTTGDNTTKLATDAFVIANALTNPMTTLGDEIYGGSSGAPTRLAGPTSPNGVPQFLIETPSAGAATAEAFALSGIPTNPQTGTTYTFVATDRTSYVTFSNASAIAVTLPQAGSTGFASNFVTIACDIGAGTATITPTTSTISYTTGSAYTSGATSMALTTGQCAWLFSDNTNYFALQRTGGSGSGTVTSIATSSPLGGGTITTSGTLTCVTCVTSAASLTSGELMTGAGSQGSQVANLTGDVTTSGSTATTVVQVEGAAIPTSAAVLSTNSSKQLTASTGHQVVGPLQCSDTSGSGTAQSCTTTPTFTPAKGDSILYYTTTANTGALTINVNSSAADAVQKWEGTALASGDVAANIPVLLNFDGSHWQASTIGNAPAAGGSVTSIATTGPISGGTITTTGTLSCPTCVTSAASLSTNGIVVGAAGNQTSKTVDFPEVLIVPAANCNNTTAGAGWSIGSGGTVTCRAGTNNLGGYISISDTTSTFATFQVAIPEDWDTGTDPYVRVQLASTDATSGHTVIPEINVACYKGDGSTTDDVAANGFHSLSTITLNGNANRFWSSSNVQMNSTDVTGCVAGAMMQITIGRATDTATNAEFYSATVTFPRLIVVQAN